MLYFRQQKHQSIEGKNSNRSLLNTHEPHYMSTSIACINSLVLYNLTRFSSSLVPNSTHVCIYVCMHATTRASSINPHMGYLYREINTYAPDAPPTYLISDEFCGNAGQGMMLLIYRPTVDHSHKYSPWPVYATLK